LIFNLNGAQSVAVSGNYAFAVSRIADSLSVVDVSNKASPPMAGVLVYSRVS